jgi:hypothetical protein
MPKNLELKPYMIATRQQADLFRNDPFILKIRAIISRPHVPAWARLPDAPDKQQALTLATPRPWPFSFHPTADHRAEGITPVQTSPYRFLPS